MQMLRVFLGEQDHYKNKPMYEYILQMCYNEGIAGATVFKGLMGYGHKRHIHRTDFFSLSGDQPIIIEIIESKEQIAKLKPQIEALPFDGILIVRDVDVSIIRKDN